MKLLIEVKNVRKIYRMGEEKVLALDNLSLSIEKGEIVCLIGASGSGKSTFLNLVAGLEKPTRGEIYVGGIPIHKLNEEKVTLYRQKNIGFIFQSFHLLPMLTALENVSLPLIFRGVDRKVRDKMAKEMLEAVGLVGFEKRKPTRMSGGQQQRVGIARALVGHPKIIFADEPTGNLDSATSKEVMDLIVKMVRENNQTLILVTHDPAIAAYADRIVTIMDGNILKIEDKRTGDVQTPGLEQSDEDSKRTNAETIPERDNEIDSLKEAESGSAITREMNEPNAEPGSAKAGKINESNNESNNIEKGKDLQ